MCAKYMHIYIYMCMHESTVAWAAWIHGCMHGDGWMDGWMDGLMDGWMNGWMDVFNFVGRQVDR